jgi:hypothetical protein
MVEGVPDPRIRLKSPRFVVTRRYPTSFRSAMQTEAAAPISSARDGAYRKGTPISVSETIILTRGTTIRSVGLLFYIHMRSRRSASSMHGLRHHDRFVPSRPGSRLRIPQANIDASFEKNLSYVKSPPDSRCVYACWESDEVKMGVDGIASRCERNGCE